MNKKVKVIMLLICILVLIIICKSILDVETINYKIKVVDNVFDVEETYNKNGYYIEIKYKDKIYPVKIFGNSNNERKIIDKIYYYNDKQYECVFPILKQDIVLDMMCYSEGILYNYHDLMGDNDKLDEYVKSIEEYNIDNFYDNITKVSQNKTIHIYKNNKIDNNFFITTYRGVFTQKGETILFDDDIYNNTISAFVDNYYITADYNQTHEFSYFYVVNLKNNEVFKIKSKYEISFDSYIQGIVDSKIYLYDRNNEKQYEINIDDKQILLVSNKDKVKYYTNNKWETINTVKANKELLFDYTTLGNDFSDYDYTILNKEYGLYYLLKKDENYYNIYKVNIENINVIKYLFKTTTKDIKVIKDYLYFEDNNNLYYYSDKTGLRTILKNTEFQFNDTIKFYIY